MDGRTFKIGDRVKICDPDDTDQATVVSRNSEGEMALQWDHLSAPGAEWWTDSELELVSAAPVTPSDVFAEVARSISIRQSATETAEQFVRRIWSAVELQRGVTP